jgi:hypothetical protein
MRITRISAAKGDSLSASPFNSEVCRSNAKVLQAEWDKVEGRLVARLERLGSVGNAKPDADFDVNPDYKIRNSDLFSRFIEVCVVSERGARLDFLKAVHSVLKKSRRKYRICVRPEVVGWEVFFYVFLEATQAQIWCNDKTYCKWLEDRLRAIGK